MQAQSLSEIYAKEDGILAQYLDYLVDEEGLLPNTAYNYYMTLRSLAKFLKCRRNHLDCQPDEVIMTTVSEKEMMDITEEEWLSYLDYFQYAQAEKDSSLAVRISVIRGFYIWLSQSTSTKDIRYVTETARPAARATPHITVTDKMEESICNNMEGDHKERNICIARLLLHCGISLEELCALDMEDIELDTIVIWQDERKNKRELPLDKVSIEAINDYIAVRNPPTDGSNAFLVSYRKGRMRRGTIQKLIKKAISGEVSLSSITVRDLQLTAKERIVRTHGVESASALVNIKSPYYYKSIFEKESRVARQ